MSRLARAGHIGGRSPTSTVGQFQTYDALQQRKGHPAAAASLDLICDRDQSARGF